MAFSIEGFKARGLQLGGARPSLFQVRITFPQNLDQSGNMMAQQGGRFLITATQLPAWTIGEVKIPYFGREVKFKGDRTFQDWNVTVLCDEDFGLRDAFESWSNEMNYMESNIMDTDFVAQGYKVDCFIDQFAKDGEPGQGTESGHIIRSYQMIGAWPTTISTINLSWGDMNAIESFDVTFAYDWFQPVYGATVSIDQI